MNDRPLVDHGPVDRPLVDHGHGPHAHPPARPARSLLLMGLGPRLFLVAALIVPLWALVLWGITL